MKTNTLIIGAIALAIGISACQNKSSNTNSSEDHSTMSHEESQGSDTSHAHDSPIMAAMNNMMKDMHQMKMTGNADYDLISMLKSHHKGAIDMAKAELQSGSDAKLKTIAQNTVDKQSKEVDMLDKMLGMADQSKKDYDPNNKESGLGKDMNDNMMKMMEMNHDAAGSIDHEFASMMIKHHKDGIDMGNIILKHAKMQDFKAMAQKMIDDQTKEISELEQSMSSH